MRVSDGYKPKIKFSVSFFPETYYRLDALCKEKGIHRANFIEEAVLARLDDGLRPRSSSSSMMRSSTNLLTPSRSKKQGVGMLARKPKRKG